MTSGVRPAVLDAWQYSSGAKTESRSLDLRCVDVSKARAVGAMGMRMVFDGGWSKTIAVAKTQRSADLWTTVQDGLFEGPMERPRRGQQSATRRPKNR